MNRMLFGGLGLSVGAIVIATVIDGNSFAPLLGPSSFVLVFFGTIGAGIMAYRKEDLSRIPGVLRAALKGTPPDLDATVTTLGALSDTARRDGMLALETMLEDVEDPAIRTGVQLLIDGLDAEQVREILEIEAAALDERHQVGISLFKAWGGYAPTFGMIGTVVGLVNMLQNLTDPAQLGIGMALALLTTLYGVLMANLLFLPLASRLERLNDLELAAAEVALDGVLCLQGGMSPRLLVERLETYLPTAQRIGHKARMAGPDAAEPVAEAA